MYGDKKNKMKTKRAHIEAFRMMMKERNADSRYTNQQLYNILFDQAKWLIKREINGGSIYKNPYFFSLLSCWDVIEGLDSDTCCSIKPRVKLYRTKNKIPETWLDKNGPVILSVTSIDDSTDFRITTPKGMLSTINDPYKSKTNNKYTFFENGYLWFTVNPNKVNIRLYSVDDIRLSKVKCEDCENEENKCIRFLDTDMMIPDWIEAEMYSKALQLLYPLKQFPEDEQIDKNTNRKT